MPKRMTELLDSWRGQVVQYNIRSLEEGTSVLNVENLVRAKHKEL
jgi:hypothetical protein